MFVLLVAWWTTVSLEGSLVLMVEKLDIFGITTLHCGLCVKKEGGCELLAIVLGIGCVFSCFLRNAVMRGQVRMVYASVSYI